MSGAPGPTIDEGSQLHRALAFVATHDPDPVTFDMVDRYAAFDTKTLDRLRTKTAERRIDRAVVEVPVVTRCRPEDGPFEYRMTDLGWKALDELGDPE